MLAIQEEEGQIFKTIQEYKEQVEKLEKENNDMKLENYTLLSAKDTALLASTSTDSADQLARALADMNFKVELGKIKDELSKKEDELGDLNDLAEKRDAIISDLQETKVKLQKNVECLTKRLTGKPPLKGAKHLAWDQIAVVFTKHWS